MRISAIDLSLCSMSNNYYTEHRTFYEISNTNTKITSSAVCMSQDNTKIFILKQHYNWGIYCACFWHFRFQKICSFQSRHANILISVVTPLHSVEKGDRNSIWPKYIKSLKIIKTIYIFPSLYCDYNISQSNCIKECFYIF